MSVGAFSRYQCWHDERIDTVINKDAVAIDRANFLATHSPFTDIVYERSRHQMDDTSEDGLLIELLRLADDNEHGFMVVQGIPGSGKSHLIRWLWERYRAENLERDDREIVLLIERAASSLRGTLNQIVESEELRASGVYDDRTIVEQLDRIRNAANALSSEGLADSLLNELQVATTETTFPGEETLNRRILIGAGPFLLDLTARDWLKRPGGPVERLIRFLTEGRRSGVAPGELPGFEAHDFDFDPDVLRELRDRAYQAACNLADGLLLRESLREEFAQFLNRRLNFAIGRTTALSADDLKVIFNDIRRALHQRGLRLTLFIEDITAFTGIDVGLIDVLVTQHTGEGNRQYCRIISVVGITPDYYQQRLPDNLKERVTHRLRLTGDEVSRANGRPALSKRAIIDLAARYLNALRLTQDDLDTWMKSGARPEQLPNACYECPFRPTCHASFGYVSVAGAEQDHLHLGLYPFNDVALVTMFERLDPAEATSTPRSLLDSVLRYILATHGATVKRGEFPPPRTRLGSDFTAPTLAKPAQARTIDIQAGSDAGRVESLVAYWGNRTVDATVDGGRRLVGGLSEEIFTAFSIKFIQGESGAEDTSGTIEIAPPPPPPPAPALNPYHEDIDRWAEGGQLTRYEDLRRWLSAYAKAAIDWEAYGIAQQLVGERLTNRRIKIEDQSGAVQGDHILLLRTRKLIYALRAAADLSTQPGALDQVTLGSHLMALRFWLDELEDEIVEFVRRPRSDQPEPIPYVQLLVIDAMLLECLAGRLSPDRATIRELYTDLVKSAAAAHGSRERAIQDWDAHVTQTRDIRSASWTQLMRRIGGDRAQSSRSLMLQALNRSQGGASSVKFVDASTALDALEAFRAAKWQLPEAAVSEKLTVAWTKPWETFAALSEHFHTAMSTEQRHLSELREALAVYLGSDDPATVFAAVDEFLSVVNQYGESPGGFERQPEAFSARGLEYHARRLELAANEQNPIQRLLRLSATLPVEMQIHNYLNFFAAFVKLLDAREASAERAVERLREEQWIHLRDDVLRLYDAIDRLAAEDVRDTERLDIVKEVGG